MDHPRRVPAGPTDIDRTALPVVQDVAVTSIRWLFGVFILCLALLLGLRVVFSDLQAELNARSVNERARLFIGEEIVRGIQGIEKDLYRMASTSNLAGLRRVNLSIEGQMEKLRHDLNVLKQGGTVRREVQLNLEGRDEMVREVAYQPDQNNDRHVMELIEIAPLLDTLGEKTRELEDILVKSWEFQEREDLQGFFDLHVDSDLFIKHIPPYFERIAENANRLFFDSSEQLRKLETALQLQSDRLKAVELSLVVLVILLTSLAGWLFLKRIGQANRQLANSAQDMRIAKDAAERASRAKSEFVSRMSHELRTPLNAIIGFAELLEAEPLAPSHRNYVNLIGNSGKHLMELINAVLDHAKIEAGSMTLERIAFDLHIAIDAVRTIVGDRATAKGLEFNANIDPSLPRFVVGDPTRLRQILINLLVNAIKFTAHGYINLCIAREDQRMIFSVRDSGIGMDAAGIARLFQPFSQADDSITRKFGGTGLGLMISKELIEAMGGAIDVESAPNVGSVFRFWLPLREAASIPECAAVAAPSNPQETLASLVAGRVLLVDDNRVNQQLAGAMLNRLGLSHDFANNGAEALRQLASADYALVLMDMEMPEMDGVTATTHIRAQEAARGTARLPIIAMTANAMQEDRERCFAAGMDGYLSKPVRLATLHTEVHRLFSATPAS
ncbi:ATP-binding protein [uncultured Thiocystis sp.]|jgi:signal transduction histidine kinase/ActR/RegA family two-component response regulator|uniref:hybrid sensor histidine kinase/response regulator n=1 Tax=uncultured Thiocystis sp. TaxID=1202134 RepID=UPI0025FFC68C|nr:ATP-binding protein [uncultured Thiocystis sp.]